MCRWNFTPSPGWTKEEANILKLCLMKYGVGRWVQILETGLLPGKMIQQLNGQTQRLLGQQSLAGACPLARPHVLVQTQECAETCAGAVVQGGQEAAFEVLPGAGRQGKRSACR